MCLRLGLKCLNSGKCGFLRNIILKGEYWVVECIVLFMVNMIIGKIDF